MSRLQTSFVARIALTAFVVVATLLTFLPRIAASQIVPKKARPFICTSNCPPPPPPTATISPGTETTSNGLVDVTITLCDSLNILADTVRLNGSVVTSTFSTSGVWPGGVGCRAQEILEKTLVLSPGATTVSVVVYSNANGVSQMGSASATYTYTPPTAPAVRGVRVLASASQASVPPSSPISESFSIANTGAVTDTFTLTASCTGPALITSPPCTLSSSSAILTAGQKTAVTVSSTTQSIVGPNGQLTIRAVSHSSATTRDSAFTVVNVVAYPVGLDVVDVNPGVSFNRDACLATGVAPGAVFQCGELRIVHPLPTVRTYNKARTPTLVYNSRIAVPFQPISALLTIAPPSGKTLSHVTGTLSVAPHGPGHTPTNVASGTWPGTDWGSLTAATTRRIQLVWNQGPNNASGLYDYVFHTVRTYSDNSTAQDSAAGQYIVGPLADFEFGNGWWLAGLENIKIVDSAIAWFGGDGDTQLYTPCGTNIWCPWNSNNVFGASAIPQAYVDGRDSIMYDGKAYTRYVPHGGRVVFTPSGYDTAAFDRLGHETRFLYDSTIAPDLRLSRIVIPTPSNDTAMYYRFVYTTHYTFDSVSAPYTNGTRRAVAFHNQRLVQTMGESHLAIHDPDGDSVAFAWSTASHDSAIVLQSMSDKLGTNVAFTFAQDHGMLASATINMQGHAANITRTFTTPGFGLAAPDIPSPHAVISDSAFIVLHGPRSQVQSDSGDTTRFWVDQMWQPLRVRDAHGYETDVAYGNLMFPTLPLRIEFPNQRVLTFAHGDGRGNVTQVIDSGTIVNGVVATSNYVYNPHFDFLTKIDPPLHDSLTITYDGNGNAITGTDASGDSSRVTYAYYVYGLMSSRQLPNTPKDSVEYDPTLGNLSAARTARDYWTLHGTDLIGRDTVVISPVAAGDSTHNPTSASIRDTARTQFDIMDRPVFTLSIAPPYQAVSRQSYSVTTNYDAEGDKISTQIQPSPDIANLEQLTTFYFYDAARRLSFTIFPNGSKDSTYYDAAGNADTTYTRRGAKIVRTFDALERLLQRSVPTVTYPSLTVGIAAEPGLSGTTQNPAYGNLTIASDLATFLYDPSGHLIEADNADTHVSRSYDSGNHLIQEVQHVRARDSQDFATHTYTINYGYDLDNRRTTLVHPSQLGPVVGGSTRDTSKYGYDAKTGRLNTVTEPLGGVFTYGYTARGDLRSLLFTDAATQEVFTTDADGNLIQDDIGPVHSSPTTRHTVLTYDPRGKATFAANQFDLEDTVFSYYSGLGQLVGHSATFHPQLIGGGRENANDAESYVLDPLGNIVSTVTSTNLSQAHALDATVQDSINFYAQRIGEQVTRYGGHGTRDTILFDPAGNIYLSYQPGIPVIGDAAVDRASYYGADDRLRMADYRTVGNPNAKNVTISTRVVEQYRYDALGRRVLKEATLWCPNTTTYFSACQRSTLRRTVWDGTRELDEIQMQDTSVVEIAEADNGVVRLGLQCNGECQDNNPWFGRVLYTYGLDASQPLAVTRVDYADSADNTGAAIPYYLHPPLTLEPIWNAWGRWDLVLNFDCTAYGGQSRCLHAQEQGGLSPYDNLGFSAVSFVGSVLDDRRDEAETRYRFARNYDPVTGRFTQEDPSGLGGGLNLYGYAYADPINYSDPLGLCPPADADYRTCNNPLIQAAVQIGRNADATNEAVAGFLPGNLIAAIGGLELEGFAGRVVQGIRAYRAAKNLAGEVSEATSGEATDYVDVTNPGSIANRSTNMTQAAFEDNLEESGFTRSTSKDGRVTIFSKDGVRYTVRGSSKSTGGPTAEFFPAGSDKATLKIRLQP